MIVSSQTPIPDASGARQGFSSGSLSIHEEGADTYNDMPGKQRLVLVVDDEMVVCDLLRRQLERWNYRVKTAISANDALELMLAEPAAVLIVDLRMPGHDGFWLMERVHEKWPETIAIVASGADDVASVTRSRSVGAVDYVLKPFVREMLWQAMARANDAIERLTNPATASEMR